MVYVSNYLSYSSVVIELSISIKPRKDKGAIIVNKIEENVKAKLKEQKGT